MKHYQKKISSAPPLKYRLNMS